MAYILYGMGDVSDRTPVSMDTILVSATSVRQSMRALTGSGIQCEFERLTVAARQRTFSVQGGGLEQVFADDARRAMNYRREFPLFSVSEAAFMK